MIKGIDYNSTLCIREWKRDKNVFLLSYTPTQRQECLIASMMMFNDAGI